MPARVEPQTPLSRSCAAVRLLTGSAKRVAARIRMATLTKKAPFSATSESNRLYFSACRLPSSVCGKERVCTRAECR
jgi:hypothetical protein